MAVGDDKKAELAREAIQKAQYLTGNSPLKRAAQIQEGDE